MQIVKSTDSGRREFVVDQLLAFIRSKELRPGARLPAEPALSEMFGVSRTVVREAMQSLQATGTIRVEQGRGTFVAENPLAQPFNVWATMNAHRVGELFEVRLILEGEAASRAAAARNRKAVDEIAQAFDALRDNASKSDWLHALAADIEFHRAVTRASELPLLQEMLEVAIPVWIDMTSKVAKERNEAQRLGFVVREHAAILKAIQKADRDGARAAMCAHLRNSRDRRIKNDQNAT